MKYRARAMITLLVLVASIFVDKAYGLTPNEEYAPATVFAWQEPPSREPASTPSETKRINVGEHSPEQVFHWEWNDRMPSSVVDKKVNYRELEEYSPENVFKY